MRRQQAAMDHIIPDSISRAEYRHHFDLDFSWTMVNHGAYGAPPRQVLAFQEGLRRKIEQHPTVHMRRQSTALRRSAEFLAERLGARKGSLAFTENATTAANAVLKSLALPAGSEILLFSQAYSAVKNTATSIARARGLSIVTIELPFPHPEHGAIVGALSSRISAQTRLVILDHVASPSGIVMPLPALIGLCHEANVPVLVDGAHAPGQLDLNLSELGPTWYFGTCHKWLFAPRSVGFVWANWGNEHSIHPAVTSRGFDQGFAAEFDWTGTRDATAALSIQAAFDFFSSVGGHGMMRENHVLVCDAAQYLAEGWGTSTAANGDFFASMASIELPLATSKAIDPSAVTTILEDRKCDVSVSRIGDRLWARISANIYNMPNDYDRLCEVVKSLRL